MSEMNAWNTQSAEIAGYADSHDFADEMRAGRLVEAGEVDPDSMVSTRQYRDLS